MKSISKFNSLRAIITSVLLVMVLLPTLTIGTIAYSLMFESIRADRMQDVGLVADTKHSQLALALAQTNKAAKQFLTTLGRKCGGNTIKQNQDCASDLIKSFLAAEGAIGATLHKKGGDTLTIKTSSNPVQENIGVDPDCSLGEGVSQNQWIVVRASAQDIGLKPVLRSNRHTEFKPGQLAQFCGNGPVNNRSYYISVTEALTGYRMEVSYPSSLLYPIFDHPPAELGLSGETFLADGEGHFVTMPRYESTQGHEHPITAAPMQSCLSGKSGEVLDLVYRDAKIIHGYRFIPEFGSACIMAHISQEEAFTSLKLLEQRTFAALVLFGVLFALLAAYLARRIVNPVIRLTHAAHAIAEGNYQIQAEVEGSNEISALATTFNFMANRLHASQQQILQDNAELERRVQERTLQLEAAYKELESFNYSVAHDLRTPLRSICGFSQILSGKYHDLLDETGKSYLERIYRAGLRMGHLIDDLLQLSRVTRGSFRLMPVDLSEIAQSVADNLDKSNSARSVRFNIQQGLHVQADPGLLHIVMENLLGNAYKFTSQKAEAEIQFGAQDIDGEIAYVVRDNGDGFDMGHAGKLFGAFQRLHASHEFEGTGIGLATVQRIIQRHHGKVWAEAKAGEGATFYFTLP